MNIGSLRSLGPLFKEWSDTRTFSYSYISQAEWLLGFHVFVTQLFGRQLNYEWKRTTVYYEYL